MCAAMANQENLQGRIPGQEYRLPHDAYTPRPTASEATPVCDLYYSEPSFNPLGIFTSHYTLGSQYKQDSFNEPLVLNSELTTLASHTMDASLNAFKFPQPSLWSDQSAQMSYANSTHRDARSYNASQDNRMKSASVASTGLVQSQQHLQQVSQSAEFPGIKFSSGTSSYNSPNTPQTPLYPQPYTGGYSAHPTTSPASTSFSTPVLVHPQTPSWSQQPMTSQYSSFQSPAPAPLEYSSSLRRGAKRSNEALNQPQQYEQPPHPVPAYQSTPFNMAMAQSQRSDSPLPERRRDSEQTPQNSAANDWTPQEQAGGLSYAPYLPQPHPQVQPPQQIQQHRSSSLGHAQAGGHGYQYSEAEYLLLRLRSHEPALDWKTTAVEYNKIMGTDKRIAALQMQYMRCKEKRKTWLAKDITLLRKIKKADDDGRWIRISAEMTKGGAKWTHIACGKQWAELHPDEFPGGAHGPTPSPRPEEYEGYVYEEEQQEEPSLPMMRHHSHPGLGFSVPRLQSPFIFRAGPDKLESIPQGINDEQGLHLTPLPFQPFITPQYVSGIGYEQQHFLPQSQVPQQHQQQQQPHPSPFGVPGWQLKTEED